MSRTRRALSGLSLLLAAVLGAATLTATATPALAAATTGFRFVDITAADGVVLKANVDRAHRRRPPPGDRLRQQLGPQRPRVPRPGRHARPAAATPSSPTPRAAGGPPAARSTPPGRRTWPTCPRSSTGRSRNTAADPARIGAAGVSYGAGISLLALGVRPAHPGGRRDERLDRPGRTRCTATTPASQQAAGLLQVAADLLGRPSPELTGEARRLLRPTATSTRSRRGPGRSAATYRRRHQRQPPGRPAWPTRTATRSSRPTSWSTSSAG